VSVIFVAGRAYNLWCDEGMWVREVVDAWAAPAFPAGCMTAASGAR
jgi:hypothetical protein